MSAVAESSGQELLDIEQGRDIVPLLDGNSDEIVKRMSIHELILLGYAFSDIELSKGHKQGATAQVRQNVANHYLNLQASFPTGSRNSHFINGFVMIALSYAHHIGSARRKLDSERAFCTRKRDMDLRIETGLSWINSLIKLSGQLVLIGGVVGILSWLLIGKTNVSTNPLHQTLLAIATAFASMIFSMAMQLRAMTMSHRRINLQYHLGYDKAKEKQAGSLEEGLIKTQERFVRLLRERFGEECDLRERSDISSELSIFAGLKQKDDAPKDVSYGRIFFDWITSLLSTKS